MTDKVVVCRCEDVLRPDIEEAVARGYRDLESVKRYTGLGTGWCQGKHCLSSCVRVLVASGGLAPEEPFTPRPPLHPVPLALLATIKDRAEDQIEDEQ